MPDSNAASASVLAYWVTMLFSVAGSAFGAAILTQFLTLRRDLRTKRDELRLELYQQVIDQIVHFEGIRAKRVRQPVLLTEDEQQTDIRLRHRLGLLASSEVAAKYEEYHAALFEYLDTDLTARPSVPVSYSRIDDLKIELRSLMRADFGNLLVEKNWSPKDLRRWVFSKV